MTLEFENAISIQPVEGSGSGLQFQNAIYIQPQDEGGGGGGGNVGAMYESTYVDSAWSDYVELADNTVAEISRLRPFGTDNYILGEYWDYTGTLTLTLTFEYSSGLSSSLTNVPITIDYIKDGYGHSISLKVTNHQIRINIDDQPSKALTAGHTYTIKLSINADNNLASFYCKEEGVDSDFVLIGSATRNYAYSYSPTKRLTIQNYLQSSTSGNPPYYKWADFDLTDITIDIDGEVIFSRK